MIAVVGACFVVAVVASALIFALLWHETGDYASVDAFTHWRQVLAKAVGRQ